MVEIQVVAVVILTAPFKFCSKEQRILKGGVDQTEILDVIVRCGKVFYRNEGVEQWILVVDFYFDIVKSIAISRNTGRFEGKFEITFICYNASPNKRIGIKKYFGEKHVHDLVVDLKIEIQILSIRNFKRFVVGINTTDGVLNQSPQLIYLKLAAHVPGNNVRGIDFDGTDGIFFIRGVHRKILKEIGVVGILIGSVREIHLPDHVIQVIPFNVHVDMPFEDADAVINKVELLQIGIIHRGNKVEFVLTTTKIGKTLKVEPEIIVIAQQDTVKQLVLQNTGYIDLIVLVIVVFQLIDFPSDLGVQTFGHKPFSFHVHIQRGEAQLIIVDKMSKIEIHQRNKPNIGSIVDGLDIGHLEIHITVPNGGIQIHGGINGGFRDFHISPHRKLPQLLYGFRNVLPKNFRQDSPKLVITRGKIVDIATQHERGLFTEHIIELKITTDARVVRK